MPGGDDVYCPNKLQVDADKEGITVKLLPDIGNVLFKNDDFLILVVQL